jgi:exopolyphosphatase/guanosine-5'-triphosphate,3'-diphosphate pyrophosphatase
MSVVGIIDIGTNTVLCLKASIKKNNIEFMADNRYHYRAGKRLDNNGNISSDYKTGMKQALKAAMSTLNDCTDIKIVATEVLRKPKDGQACAAEFAAEIGQPIAIIDSQYEAELSFLGATSGVIKPDEKVAVIDIGGGSSELAIGRGDGLERWSCVQLGAVAISEAVGYEKSLDEYLDWARPVFDRSDFASLLKTDMNRMLIVGGSAVAVAAILVNLKEFQPEKIQGYIIRRDILGLLMENLANMSLEKRAEIMPFDAKRADIIVGGGAIILVFMTKYGFEAVEISTKGLRHGILLEHFAQLNA